MPKRIETARERSLLLLATANTRELDTPCMAGIIARVAMNPVPRIPHLQDIFLLPSSQEPDVLISRSLCLSTSSFTPLAKRQQVLPFFPTHSVFIGINH